MIVKSIDNDINSQIVVSIDTGSNFFYEKNLDFKDNAVHDTHTDVVARRGFIRYIHSSSIHQITQCVAKNSSKFQKSDDVNGKLIKVWW